MIAPYDYDALLTKAKVFLNRAMDPDSGRSFDEQALWASAALELLGKAALARVSPLLIANPSEEGANLLIATGLLDAKAKFTSVTASTIFKRCDRAFRPFDQKTAQDFADARNEYLHGAAIDVATLPPHAWWPKFWSQASILVTAQDRDLEALVGPDRVGTVEYHLEQNTKNIEHRTEALINRAKQRLAQHLAGTLPAKLQREWDATTDLTAGLKYSAEETCPACDATGTVEGEDWEEISYDYDSPGAEWEDLAYATPSAIVTVPAEHFSCPNCHLVLDRYELIDRAGLNQTFETIDDAPAEEPDYGND